ncbi:aminodeoxychorismate synthase component I [Pseudomonas resinovorans]|uniref:aminodeoxychorismate synthase n=1 Tax=Metapseudomonas resinovorans TaxID=53412 RepID=A0ABT4YA84_METRE|nr:aminodeoxychorismate synthase component I [Pseudomonas resinovorans]MDA8485791.1 aminodeoxychorismate synthase component I [Pseudomonas resinovorans]
MPDCHLHVLPYQESPCERFALVRQAPGAVLLDAGRPVAERGRYDLFSAWPLAAFAATPGESANDFAQRLRKALARLGEASLPAGIELPFVGGLIGYLAYDFGRRVEQLPEQAIDDLQLPDARLGLYAWALVSDHQLRTSQLVFHPSLEEAERARLITLFSEPKQPPSDPFRLRAPFSANLTEERYRSAIERVQAYIQAGDCYQVNFTQRFQAPCEGDPWTAYQALRTACPTPFAGYQALDDGGAILSLSPERFIKVSQGQVETRPIKGTRPRGRTPEEDRTQADELLASRKDRAENLMIVDLLRNDLGRSCAIGSVRVPELFALESYPNVHHLVSAITGRLADDKDALDLITGSFPGGSITGAPKIRAMQIIDELEPNRRSIYCGSLLYLDVRGELDSSIAIRTVLVKDGQASCWGGGGIVADSDWQEEYRESITKVKVLMTALEGMNT